MSLSTTADLDMDHVPETEIPVVSESSDDCNCYLKVAWIFVLIGISARLLRYLLKFPLWGDECMLAENFITRDAAGLLKPLVHSQVAPVGFIELVWGVTRVFGFNEWSLRLIAFASSLVGLLALRKLAFRLLPPAAAMFAVAFLAVGYYPVRHSTELKPYAVDLAWAAVLLLVAELASRNLQRHLWLVLLMALTPLALLTSFTATFVAGGICLGLAYGSLVRRSVTEILWVAVYGAVLVASFVGVYLLTATGQFSAHAGSMQAYWKNSFPPSLMQEPIAWIKWIVETHTGEMFAYPLGSNHGGSSFTFLLAMVGVVSLWKSNRRWFLVACAGTFGLGYVASALHRYPYGNNERLVQYLAPMICLLAGTGAAFLVERIQIVRNRRAAIWTICTFLALVSFGSSLRDLIRPYKSHFDLVHRGMAQWFWRPDREPIELYCVRSDLGFDFWADSWHSHYVCYQHIYSPRHPIGQRTRRIEDLPADRPVNIVVYSNEDDPQETESWNAWMRAMSERFNLSDCVDHRVLVDRKPQQLVWGHYRVYRFSPKPPPKSE